MIQYVLCIFGGRLSLIDPDGSVITAFQLQGPMATLASHLQDGDQISVTTMSPGGFNTGDE